MTEAELKAIERRAKAAVAAPECLAELSSARDVVSLIVEVQRLQAVLASLEKKSP